MALRGRGLPTCRPLRPASVHGPAAPPAHSPHRWEEGRFGTPHHPAGPLPSWAGPRSPDLQEAENRLWAQMGALVELLGLAPAVAPFVAGIRESAASPQRQRLVKA